VRTLRTTWGTARGARPALSVLLNVLLLFLLLGWRTAALAAAQEETVPPAGPPLSVSARLLAQGHPVQPAEAVYLDADEQVTERYIGLLVVVDFLASMFPNAAAWKSATAADLMPPDADDWKSAMVACLQALAALNPGETPVPPPAGLMAVHGDSVAYREHLAAAAREWLAGVEADDPAWRERGLGEYGEAERARLAWYKELWEHYTGQPAPGP